MLMVLQCELVIFIFFKFLTWLSSFHCFILANQDMANTTREFMLKLWRRVPLFILLFSTFFVLGIDTPCVIKSRPCTWIRKVCHVSMIKTEAKTAEAASTSSSKYSYVESTRSNGIKSFSSADYSSDWQGQDFIYFCYFRCWLAMFS